MSMDLAPVLTVRAIAPPEVDQAVAVICLAFSSDPAARWTYPNPHVYVSYFPEIRAGFRREGF
jgi:hypothetical protein